MNYVKKLNLHWFCTQNHILEPFSVRRACTKSYVTSEPYPRVSQIWCQNVRETWKKKVIKCRSESFARCRVITQNVEGGPFRPPPSLFRVKPSKYLPVTTSHKKMVTEEKLLISRIMVQCNFRLFVNVLSNCPCIGGKNINLRCSKSIKDFQFKNVTMAGDKFHIDTSKLNHILNWSALWKNLILICYKNITDFVAPTPWNDPLTCIFIYPTYWISQVILDLVRKTLLMNFHS